MAEDIILMRVKEIERLRIIHKVFDKQITQVKASQILPSFSPLRSSTALLFLSSFECVYR